jgi:fatty-acyl-CoA synthase
VDLEDLVALEVAVPARAGRASKRVPSCGPAFGMELRIAGGAGARSEREVGEVQFRGQGLMRGYVGPGAEEGFDDEGWMHTGDVGYLAGGEVFITGRIKEVLVRQGKKYHPEDIERAAAAGAGVTQDECVAFTPLSGDEGEIILVLETSDVDDIDAVDQRVRAAVVNRLGITLQSVIFVEPKTLPKTSSGKAQRLAVRDQHARGELEVFQ